MYTEGMPVGQITNMMLSELAPHLDEVYAYVFEQIDATSATPQEAEQKKKGFLKKHWKTMLGTAAVLGTGAHMLSKHGASVPGAGRQNEGAVGYLRNIGVGAKDIYGRGWQGNVDVAKARIDKDWNKLKAAPGEWWSRQQEGAKKGWEDTQEAWKKRFPGKQPE